jgi:hypothetical protein
MQPAAAARTISASVEAISVRMTLRRFGNYGLSSQATFS